MDNTLGSSNWCACFDQVVDDDAVRSATSPTPQWRPPEWAGGIAAAALNSDDEQERRFQTRIDNPEKRWKLPMDLYARARWVDYVEATDEMFACTDTRESPWYVVNADNKNRRG